MMLPHENWRRSSRSRVVHQMFGIVLPKAQLVCSHLHLIEDDLHVCTRSIGFRCPHHVHLPLIVANLRHDVSHTCGVHRDAVAIPLEVVKLKRHEVHPLLHCSDVDVTRFKILVRLAAKYPSVQLVCCKWAVCQADGMHCCTSADGLWLWPLCDGSVIPAGCAAFIHRKLTSKDHRRLPLRIECIFNDHKLTPMMRHIQRQLNLCVSEVVLPNFFVLLPIVRKVHASLHVRECTARHALLCCPNSIKRLTCAPTVIDQWQTLDCTHKLTLKEACDVIRLNVFFIHWIKITR